MRISDWSSDVCSSDLSVQRQKIGCKVETQRGLLIASIADRLFVTANRASNAGRAMLCTEIDKRLTQKLAGVIFRKRKDRKSVASGKSVSVRVDLGGSRISQKNTAQHQTLTSAYIK